MKLYLVNDSNGNALRFEGTQSDAKSASKLAEGDFEQFEVPTDKAGLIEFLNTGNPLTGQPSEDSYETVVERQDPQGPSSSDVSIAIEDAWDKLPLATQLHYAARAVEDARDQIKPAKAEVETITHGPDGWETAETSTEDDADDLLA